MRLLDAESGIWVLITGYQGGTGVEHKLRQLGIMPGSCLRVIRHAPFGGPLLIEIEGRSVALGRGIAAKIKVEAGISPCN